MIEKATVLAEPRLTFYRGFRATESLTFADIRRRITLAYDQFKTHFQSGEPIVISLPNSSELFVYSLAAIQFGSPILLLPSPDLSDLQSWLVKFREIAKLGLRQAVTVAPVVRYLEKERIIALSALTYWPTDLELPLPEPKQKLEQAVWLELIDADQPHFGLRSWAWQQMQEAMVSAQEMMGVRPGDRVLSSLPLSCKLGFWLAAFQSWRLGVETHFVHETDLLRDAALWLKLSTDINAQVWLTNDIALRTISKTVVSSQATVQLKTLRSCWNCDQNIGLSNPKPALSDFGAPNIEVLSALGSPEVPLLISANRHSEERRGILSRAYGQNFFSSGKLLDGLRAQIRDAKNNILGDGEVGEIWIAAANSSGQVSWQTTQNYGFFSDHELFIVGSSRDFFFKRGRQVSADEVAGDVQRKVGSALYAVKFFARFSGGIEHHYLAAEVEPGLTRRDELRTRIARSLLDFNVPPTNIFLLPKHTMPRHASGAVDVWRLKEWAAQGRLQSIEKRFWLIEARRRLRSVITRNVPRGDH